METQFLKLTKTQRNKLLKLLHKFEELFNGKISTWKKDPLYFNLKDDGFTFFSSFLPLSTHISNKVLYCVNVLGSILCLLHHSKTYLGFIICILESQHQLFLAITFF